MVGLHDRRLYASEKGALPPSFRAPDWYEPGCGRLRSALVRLRASR
jgi:hypothetical protein